MVYKLKKPVNYGFLDFTTLDKRRHFCEEEVRLNRRLAPDVYLGVVRVTQGQDGRLSVEGAGETVEYAVCMRRLPAEGMMLTRLARGQIQPGQMDEIAVLLADFYRRAATGTEVEKFGRRELIKHNTDENFTQTMDFVDLALSADRYETIKNFTNSFLSRRANLFERRIKGGRIRDGHGDLHLGNICLADRVYIFDCIEFNRRFRYADTASDLAFLAMDLDFHGFPAYDARVAGRYAESADDLHVLRQLLDEVNANAAVRVLVLVGEGRHFCSGFDLGALSTIDAGARFGELADALEAARPITIARLHGGV